MAESPKRNYTLVIQIAQGQTMPENENVPSPSQPIEADIKALQKSSESNLKTLRKLLKPMFNENKLPRSVIKDFDEALATLDKKARKLDRKRTFAFKGETKTSLAEERKLLEQERNDLITSKLTEMKRVEDNNLLKATPSEELKATLKRNVAVKPKRRRKKAPAPIEGILQADPIESEFKKNQEASEDFIKELNVLRARSFSANEISPDAQMLKSQVKIGLQELDERLSGFDARLAALAKEAENLTLDTTISRVERKKDLTKQRRDVSKEKRDYLNNHFNAISSKIEGLERLEELAGERDETTFHGNAEMINKHFQIYRQELENYKFLIKNSKLPPSIIASEIDASDNLLKRMQEVFENVQTLKKSDPDKSNNYAKMAVARERWNELERQFNESMPFSDDVLDTANKVGTMNRTLAQVNQLIKNYPENTFLQNLQALLGDSQRGLKVSFNATDFQENSRRYENIANAEDVKTKQNENQDHLDAKKSEVNALYNDFQIFIDDAFKNPAKDVRDNLFAQRENVLLALGEVTPKALASEKQSFDREHRLSKPFELRDDISNETEEALNIYIEAFVAANESDRSTKKRLNLLEIQGQFDEQFPEIKLSSHGRSFTYKGNSHDYVPQSKFGKAVNAYVVARETIDSALKDGDQPNVDYSTQFADLNGAKAALNQCIINAGWETRIAQAQFEKAAKEQAEQAEEAAKAAEEERAVNNAISGMDTIIQVIDKEIDRITRKHGKDKKTDPRIAILEDIKGTLTKTNQEPINLSADKIKDKIKDTLTNDRLKDLTFSKQNSLLRFVTQDILLPLANLFSNKPDLFANKTEKALRSELEKVESEAEPTGMRSR